MKGFQDCAFLVGDEAKLAEARIGSRARWRVSRRMGGLDRAKAAPGWRPISRDARTFGEHDHAVLCLQSFYDQTGDGRVLELMRRYFRYLNALPEEKFLVGYWPKMRAGDLLWSVLWLYNRTGEEGLIELATRPIAARRAGIRILINLHNVNIARRVSRARRVLLSYAADLEHLQATERVWQKVRRLYGQVPGGMYGGDENCREGYNGPRQAIETCGIAEEMLSNEILLAITGNPTWADRCENVAFNSLPAAFTADMKALRYLTAPNQPQSDHVGKAPGIENDGPMYCMDPYDHRCCQHNAGHAWPSFVVKHLWYAAPGERVGRRSLLTLSRHRQGR